MDITSSQHLDQLSSSSGKHVVLHFYADWSEPCKHMDSVFVELANQHPGVTFGRVEAEQVDDVTERFGVTSVPFFVITKVRSIEPCGPLP